jgi:hypothetical protein
LKLLEAFFESYEALTLENIYPVPVVLLLLESLGIPLENVDEVIKCSSSVTMIRRRGLFLKAIEGYAQLYLKYELTRDFIDMIKYICGDTITYFTKDFTKLCYRRIIIKQKKTNKNKTTIFSLLVHVP